MNQNNQLATTDQKRDVYCSIKPTSNQEKAALFNALEQCNYRLNDEIGKRIEIKHIYIQQYEKPDKDSGEMRKAHRTIIFDRNGETHVTASNYFANAIAKIMDIWGTPDTWTEPITIEIVKKPVKNGLSALSLKIVDNALTPEDPIPTE